MKLNPSLEAAFATRGTVVDIPRVLTDNWPGPFKRFCGHNFLSRMQPSTSEGHGMVLGKEIRGYRDLPAAGLGSLLSLMTRRVKGYGRNTPNNLSRAFS